MIAFQGNTSTKSVAQNANFCDISLLKIFEQICWRNTIKKCSKNKRYTAKKLMWSLVYLQRSRGGAACEVAFRVGFPGHAVRTDGWKERYSWGTKGKKWRGKGILIFKKADVSSKECLTILWAANPHHFNVDPDPASHFNVRIRILFLIKVMEFCDHWSGDPTGLHFVLQVIHYNYLGH